MLPPHTVDHVLLAVVPGIRSDERLQRARCVYPLHDHPDPPAQCGGFQSIRGVVSASSSLLHVSGLLHVAPDQLHQPAGDREHRLARGVLHQPEMGSGPRTRSVCDVRIFVSSRSAGGNHVLDRMENSEKQQIEILPKQGWYYAA